MKKCKIKKGDKVRVIAGNDKGKEGEALFVFPQKETIVVSGCKLIKKTVKPSEQNKEGGFETKEAPMHISNVVKVEG